MYMVRAVVAARYQKVSCTVVAFGEVIPPKVTVPALPPMNRTLVPEQAVQGPVRAAPPMLADSASTAIGAKLCCGPLGVGVGVPLGVAGLARGPLPPPSPAPGLPPFPRRPRRGRGRPSGPRT